jgi:chromosome segregation ATPase
VDRAKAAENKIATFTGDTLTGGALKTEVDRATGAEDALGKRIDDVVGDLNTTNQNLTDEIARAKKAEGDNKTAIETEANRAKAAEDKIATFGTDGKVNGGALKAEIDRATQAESDLAKDIGENLKKINDVAGDLADEETRATNAEEKIATFDNSGNLTGGALHAEQQARA